MAPPPVDYYAVLKITPRASPAEINKAYKTLALITHPDKNPSPGAKEAFQELKQAYDTLADPAERGKFDNAYFASSPEERPMADWASNSAQPSYPSSTFHARAGKEWDDDSDTEDSNPPEGNKDESAKEDEEKPTDRSTPYSRSGSKFFPKASERRPFEKYTGAETHDDDFGASKGTTFEADTTPKDGTASKQHPPTELGPSPHGVPRRGAESFRSGSSKSNWFGDCTKSYSIQQEISKLLSSHVL